MLNNLYMALVYTQYTPKFKVKQSTYRSVNKMILFKKLECLSSHKCPLLSMDLPV